MKHIWLKATVTLMLVVAVSITAWAIIDKLDDATFKVIVGVVLTLAIVLVVGGLFIGYGLVQAYIVNRQRQLDNIEDVKVLAMTSAMLGAGKQSSVNLRLPGSNRSTMPLMLGGQQEQPLQVYSGEYADTVQPIELE